MAASPILRALFGEKKARLFQTTAWPAAPVVHHGPPERLPAPLLDGDLSSFERLAASIQVHEAARGVSTPGSGFRGEVAFAGGRGKQIIRMIRGASALHLWQAGLNILFQEFRLPALEPWVDELAKQVGIANQAIRLYAFAAPPGAAQGTDAHWDPNEVIHIQRQGTKILRLAANAHVVNPDVGIFSAPFPEDLVGQFHGDVPEKPPTSWQEILLRPGSVVYFPRGHWHETSTEGPSFAVGLGFYWPTPAEIVGEQLRARLRQNAAWRAPLFGMHASASAARHTEQRLIDLVRELGLSPAHYPPGEALARWLPASQRVKRRGLTGRYVRLPLTMAQRRQKDGTVAIRVTTLRGGGRLEFDASAPIARAMSWIASRRAAFTLRDIAAQGPGLGRKEIEELLVLLLEYGVVQFDPRPVIRAGDGV